MRRSAVWCALAVLLLGAAVLAADSAEGTANVLTITADSFDQAVADHSFLVVEFYAPWCGHCKSLAPEWEKAATELKGDTSAGQAITLAMVDATVERSLAEKFHIGGFPTIKIFEGNSAANPAEYDGPRQADGIVAYLKKRAGPASKELTSAAEVEAIKKEEAVIVVNAGPATETWTKLASSMRDAVYWCHTSNKAAIKALGVKAGAITILKDFDDKAPVYSGDAADASKLKEFVDYHRRPVAMMVSKGDQAALQAVFEDENKPNIFLFTTEKDAGLDAFKAGVQGVRGKMVTARFHDSNFPEAFNHFGIDKFVGGDGLPKVLIEEKKSGLRYLMSADVTQAAVAAFLADYAAGKLEPFLKSEPEPQDASGPVSVIVGTTFDALVRNAGHWVFLEVYAPWCGHCKKLAPVWNDLGLAFEGSEGKSKVVIAKVDATANDLPKAIDVKGFPTLLLFAGDGTAPQAYDGGRDFKSLADFVSKKTGASIKLGFKPSITEEPDMPIERKIIEFLQTDFQLPFGADGQTVSGLWLTAIVIFLLFVAAISLVIACLGGGAPPPAPQKNKSD